jgi:hypothetical protein
MLRCTMTLGNRRARRFLSLIIDTAAGLANPVRGEFVDERLGTRFF